MTPKLVSELATLKGKHELKIIRDAALARKMRDDITALVKRR